MEGTSAARDGRTGGTALRRLPSDDMRARIAAGLADGLGADEALDAFVVFYDELKQYNVRNKKKQIQDFLQRYETRVHRVRDTRVQLSDFEFIKLIGRGSFAEIYLSKAKDSGQPFVVKRMSKNELLSRSESVCFREELDFLVAAASAHDSTQGGGKRCPGITALHYAFYDDEYLYLVMDFYPGGDLLGLLGKHDNFPEDMARFYLAEAVLAIESVHRLGYVHRDIKIDNLLLDAKGHVFLADFGSCARLNKDGMVDSVLSGGTPDYISPEVLAGMQGERNAVYGADCDWWSLGVVMYEMLVGETPFYADSVIDIYKNIKNYKRALTFPEELGLSEDAIDLITKLCTGQAARLGRKGADEIKQHPFFKSIDWSKLRKSRAPFIPELASATDTAFFEDFEYEGDDIASALNADKQPLLRRPSTAGSSVDLAFGTPLAFLGYWYTHWDDDKPSQRRSGGPAEARDSAASAPPQSDGTPRRTRDIQAATATAAVTIESPRRSREPPSEASAPAVAPPKPAAAPSPSPVAVPDAPSSKTPAASVAEDAPGPKKGSRARGRVRFPPAVVFFDAVRSGEIELIESMVAEGTARLTDKTDRGQNALHVAAQSGSLGVAEYLIKHGLSVAEPDEMGNTPLHLAVSEEDLEMALLLISNGAPGDVKNDCDETPIDMSNDEEVVEAVEGYLERRRQ
eukprot:Opistho-1_new@58791